MQTDRKIRRELAELDKLFSDVTSAELDRVSLSEIGAAVTAIRQNLAQLQEFLNPWPYAVQESIKRARSDKLLRVNTEGTERLTSAVERFIANERAAIAKESADVAAVEHKSSVFLLGVVALSLVSSALIVWLYVSRNIIAYRGPYRSC
jgi:hypothetical protein